ncbi:MAG: glutaredoxin domain-containing protein [Candidatus Ornithospirochaeta sp.]|nr:glutaredoxin domain-containing protein [Candidatus Ornithospirochaeta sp.]
MKKITMFHFAGCPYCRKAERFISELEKENPLYKEIEIERIDEKLNPEIAEEYDYWYVPTFYIAGKKESEGDITKDGMRKVLDKALSL